MVSTVMMVMEGMIKGKIIFQKSFHSPVPSR
jgi:hypothetical protein